MLFFKVYLNVNCKNIDERTSPSQLVEVGVKHVKETEKEHYDREVVIKKKEHKIYCKELTRNMTLQAKKSKFHKKKYFESQLFLIDCKKERERCIRKGCLTQLNSELETYIKGILKAA